MKILVIGSGGREHALAWKLAQSPASDIHIAPGNPGCAQVGICHPTEDYIGLAASIRPDLTVVGPEAPLAAGIVDQFLHRGWPIVGPVAEAAQIETSKSFAKALMYQAGVPTARYVTSDNRDHALASLSSFGTPVVLKADGLAAGKGVVVAHSREQAEASLPALFALSPRIIIEEHLVGEEVSYIVLTDGHRFIDFEPCQDHKALNDADQGPNTGGMGAYSDSRILTEEQSATIRALVIEPVLSYMRQHHHRFTGFLYAGLMMTQDGPKVLEFNARLGDPETQPLMLRLTGDFPAALASTASGLLDDSLIRWTPDPSVCVVAAATGYPGHVRTGDPITGLEQTRYSEVFHAGTKSEANVLLTAGGRVLGVAATGPTLQEAIAAAYSDIERIHFEGMHYRRDIGRKGLARW